MTQNVWPGPKPLGYFTEAFERNARFERTFNPKHGGVSPVAVQPDSLALPGAGALEAVLPAPKKGEGK